MLDELLGETLTYIHSNGMVDGKAEVLAKLRTDFRYEKLERGELEVRLVADDVAIMTGPMEIGFVPANTTTVQHMSAMLTQVWAMQEGTPRMLAYQVAKRS